MVRNLSLLALTLSHSTLSSPLFALPGSKLRPGFSLQASHFSHFLSNLIYSQFVQQSISISSSSFSNFQKSAIFLSQAVQAGLEYSKKTVDKPISTTESLTIRSCVFHKLHNYDGGGAIYSVSGATTLTISQTGFRACRSSENGGAILFDGQEVSFFRCCFDQCDAPQRGQAFHLNVAGSFDSDGMTINKCSMDRPCGESHAAYISLGNQRYRTSNVTANVVAELGACFGSSDASLFVFHYGMVSYNRGNNLFWFARGQDLRLSHCSVLHNTVESDLGVFELGASILHVEQSNFIENKFTKFGVNGKIIIDAKIVTDFDMSSRLFVGAELENQENVFKVLWIDAGIAQMDTWACWALGEPSPSASQSPRPLDGGERKESGIATFLILSVVAGIPTVFGYLWWTKNEGQGRDLSVLDPLVISNT